MRANEKLALPPGEKAGERPEGFLQLGAPPRDVGLSELVRAPRQWIADKTCLACCAPPPRQVEKRSFLAVLGFTQTGEAPGKGDPPWWKLASATWWKAHVAPLLQCGQASRGAKKGGTELI